VTTLEKEKEIEMENGIHVNDNISLVHEIQPSRAVAVDGTVSITFSERRLACSAQASREAKAAAINGTYSTTASRARCLRMAQPTTS
jgi:hypothetical protein